MHPQALISQQRGAAVVIHQPVGPGVGIGVGVGNIQGQPVMRYPQPYMTHSVRPTAHQPVQQVCLACLVKRVNLPVILISPLTITSW